MNEVAVRKVARERYNRSPSFFSAAIALGMLTPVRLCPLSVEEGQLQTFMATLNRDVLSRIATYQQRRPPTDNSPALPGTRGRRPGSGMIKRARELVALAGDGGTVAGTSSEAQS